MSIFKYEFSECTNLRRDIYEGMVYLLSETNSSLILVNKVKERLKLEFGEDYRSPKHCEDNDYFFETIGKIRKELYLDNEFQSLTKEIYLEAGFENVAFDPVRLRVVPHLGHNNPSAKAVYYAHRDTWYSHPQSLITWWIPLDDLSKEETFVFFPEYFRKEVPNNSEIFDYDEWTRKGWSLKIGWQNKDDGLKAEYPGITGEFDRSISEGFSCRAGQSLLFAGAQLHETIKQETGQTRFSLDFRIVSLDDEKRGLGAPNVDSRCKGSSLRDYVTLSSS